MAFQSVASVVGDILDSHFGSPSNISAAYRQIVDEAVTALVERDRSIADDLRLIAERQGLDSRMVDEALTEVGLAERQPEYRDAEGFLTTKENALTVDGAPVGITIDAYERLVQEVAQTKSRVETLESIARRLGYMGRPVGD